MKLRTAITSLVALVGAGLAFAACGDDSETGGGSGGDVVPFTLEGTDELFPGFEFSTGLQPELDSPIKASFTVSATGDTHVSAEVAASGTKSKPALTGIEGGGKVQIDGGFAMIGNLVSTIPGFEYDGDIPGLDNIEIPVTGEAMFDPFSIDGEVSAVAEIPEGDLPGIPLPGGIPGELIIHIAAGSTVEVGFTGTCAGIDGDQAAYSGAIARKGTLVLEPRVVAEIPFNELEIEVGSFEVPLDLGSSELSMEAKVEKLGGAPKGDTVTSSCTPGGEGGGHGAGGSGQGGDSSSPSSTDATSTGDVGSTAATGLGVTTGGGQACVSASECPNEYPCVEGTCSDGSGVCDAGLTFGDIYTDNCISVYCCDQLAGCTSAYQNLEQCNDCIANGGGSLCDPYLTCAQTNCNGGLTGICDSGLSTGDATIDQCLSDACCAEFETCTDFGNDLDGCVDCFNAGGGPQCDAAITCGDGSGC